MLSQFKLHDRCLTLNRFPKTKDKSLQAWDSADEYIIEHVSQVYANALAKPIQIINDEFGALSCWFSHLRPTVQTDSSMSMMAIQQNIRENSLHDELEFIDPLTTNNHQILGTVLIKIPKTHSLLAHQLIHLQALINEKTVIIAAGKVKQITKSTLALFETHIGPTQTSLAKKKSRLILAKRNPALATTSPFPSLVKDRDIDFTLYNYANVFCHDKLDIGARFFLQHLSSKAKKVVDLGCGNGVLGIAFLKKYTDAHVHFVDESRLAIASAKKTAQEAGVGDRASFHQSHCLTQIPKSLLQTVDLILCNPPFHQKNTITEDIAWQMFKDAKRYLKRDGELRIVANRHLNYLQGLRKLFGFATITARNNKFNIISATRR